MFEMTVEEIYTITGMGTVFAGRIDSGRLAAGDRIVCRTPSSEMAVRMIGIRDSAGQAVRSGESGATIGVVCNAIDLSSFGAEPDESGVIKPLGVRLVSAPEKKRWWQ